MSAISSNGRARRQKALAELIRTETLGSQEDVTSRLAALGHLATQATVSRDLDSLGAVKVKRGGALRYTLPDAGAADYQAADFQNKRMERIVAEWVRSVEAAGNLLVLKTPPGSAHLVGLVIDQAALPEFAGTISGDDTLFVALRDGVVAGEMASRLRRMAGQQEHA